jgi:excisionase family DNA binding protein
LEPLLLSIPSTQHILGDVGRSSVYAWLADGSLEGVKLGKSLRITLESVKRKAASAPRAVIRLGRRDAA